MLSETTTRGLEGLANRDAGVTAGRVRFTKTGIAFKVAVPGRHHPLRLVVDHHILTGQGQLDSNVEPVAAAMAAMG